MQNIPVEQVTGAAVLFAFGIEQEKVTDFLILIYIFQTFGWDIEKALIIFIPMEYNDRQYSGDSFPCSCT